MTHRAASRISSRRAAAWGESFFVPYPSFAMTVDADMTRLCPLLPLSHPCQTHPDIRTIAPYGSIVRWGSAKTADRALILRSLGGLSPPLQRVVTCSWCRLRRHREPRRPPRPAARSSSWRRHVYDPTAKVIGSCQQHHVADWDGDAAPPRRSRARAAGKLQSSIALRCCRPDRICGTADDDALGALGWGPGFWRHSSMSRMHWTHRHERPRRPDVRIGTIRKRCACALRQRDRPNVIAKESSGLVARTSKALVARRRHAKPAGMRTPARAWRREGRRSDHCRCGPSLEGSDRRTECHRRGERAHGARRHSDGDEAQSRPLRDAAGRSRLHGFASIEVPLRKGGATNRTLRGCGELGTCQDDDRLKAPLPARELIAASGLRRCTCPPKAAPGTCLSSAHVRRHASLTNPLTDGGFPE